MLVGLDGGRAILLWWTLPAYLTLVGAALLASGGLLLWETHKTWRAAHAADSALLALVFGLILARAEHVLLNWTYFAENTHEIFSLAAGGLDAHGAILGAALGGYLSARRFGADYTAWLGGAAFALPLVALVSWWGCAASGCAYGMEVANLADYPRWLVWEAAGDFLMVAPRYAVQPLGVWVSLGVLLAVIAAARLGVGGMRRAGLALLGVTLTGLALGFLRGDTAVSGVGLLLDFGFAAAALWGIVWSRRTGVPPA